MSVCCYANDIFYCFYLLVLWKKFNIQKHNISQYATFKYLDLQTMKYWFPVLDVTATGAGEEPKIHNKKYCYVVKRY